MLFFGRKNDAITQRCINHLVGLGFKVDSILSKARGDRLPEDLEGAKYDYIICYRSYFILPNSLIETTKFFNINFHPGPPNYPGSGGTNLALLNGDKEFGVTAHVMTEKVDAGPIIESRHFLVRDSDNLISLLERTHDFLFSLFVELTTRISEQGHQYIDECLEKKTVTWSQKKTKISEINNLQVVNPNISKPELAKRIRSLNHPDFPLEIHIHGSKFTYKEEL